MRSFSAQIRAQAKVNNSVGATSAKIEIRQRVLEIIGADNATVFDAFAGEGHLHKHVWAKARSYVGCDRIWCRDRRLMYVGDNRRVMRAINLDQFNIFDFDAWGSPWELVLILCARRQLAGGERIGVVLTEGNSLKARMGGLPLALTQLAGFSRNTGGVSRSLDFVVDRAIVEMTRRLNCRVLHRWEARGKTGARMVYIGLVLEEKAATLAAHPAA